MSMGRKQTAASRVAVIGAGAAGLFFAHFARKQGLQVALFESHSKPGGCASYFRRKFPEGPVLFDAGATVLSSCGEGAWLRRTVKSFGVQLPHYYPLHKISYRVFGLTFELDASSTSAWIRSLAKAFPEDRVLIEQHFPALAEQAHLLRGLSERGVHLPLEAWQDLRLNRGLFGATLGILPAWLRGNFSSFGAQLDRWGASPRLRHWIDMHLFITLQVGAYDAHPLWAVSSLFFYALGAGSLERGMNGLFEPLLEALKGDPGARVFMKTPVTRITENDKGRFDCETSEGVMGSFDYVVSSLPRYDTRRIFDRELLDSDSSWDHLAGELWASNVSYLVVKDRPEFAADPFFMHSSRVSSLSSAAEGGDCYVSFSARDDASRGSREWRAVTISTHARHQEWASHFDHGKAYREDERYLAQKKQASACLVDHFRELYPQVEIVFEEPGTPGSFWRYTRRSGGAVGGIPLSQKVTGWNALSQRTWHPRVFQIGDTSFPGPSVWACAMGAHACVEKLLNRKLSI